MSRSVHEQGSTDTVEVRSYFDRAADAFDRLYHEDRQTPWMRWVNRRFRSDIVGRFLLTSGHVARSKATSVLDVGCGSGRYLAEFARLGVERLVGIDLSQPMLDLSRTQVTAAGHSHTDLIRTDFNDFITDERFDVVVAMGFFDYQADPAAVLHRMRALAKHSVIASFPSRHWLRTPIREVRYRIKKCPVYFFEEAMIASIGRRVGFESIETVKLPGAGMDYVATMWVSPSIKA